jgi:thiamine biosynthesis lipoprotein
MGTTGLVSVVGDGALVEHGIARIQDLARRWTRFDQDSELSKLRAACGRPVAVSPDTFQLVAAACAASRITNGLFDPTVLDAMIANGYDRTFADLGERTTPTALPRPAPGIDGVHLDRVANTVMLACGVGIDPGGIGKGLAADIVADELIQLGARGVLVDIGGDISCRGEGPQDGRWVVDVAHPFRDEPILHLALTDVAIATSSCLRRRWGPESSLHHIVDPRTGRPTATRLVMAAVIDAEAWRAEALATAVIVAGDVAAAASASAIALDGAGALHASHDLLELVA